MAETVRENEELSSVMREAFLVALENKKEFFTPEHVLLSALKQSSVSTVLEKCGCAVSGVQSDLEEYLSNSVPSVLENSEDIEHNGEKIDFQPETSVALEDVFSQAILQAQNSSREEIDIFDLIVEMISDERLFCSYALRKNGLELLSLLEGISDFRRNQKSKGFGEKHSGQTALEKWTVELVEKAKNGEFDTLVGREAEISRTIHVLCRRTKNNPVHVGDSGVGKTAIAYGLASKIAFGNVPQKLKGFKIFSLDIASLVSGAKFRGDYEERFRAILDEIEKDGKAILYIDEIHSVATTAAGGGVEGATLLHSFLSDGSVRIMGATTSEDWSRSIEKNRALLRRFQKIDINEPSEAETLKIVKTASKKYSLFHNVSYSKKSLEAAVSLCAVHLPDKRFPDKALDVIDEAGAAVSIKGFHRVSENSIRAVLSKMAGIPLESATETESEKLMHLCDSLKSEIFGQDVAVEKLTLCVKKARAGFKDEGKPEGSFLFVGPTGVGKTELARSLSRFLSMPLLRFDMGEYQESYTVSRLVGSAPGYVGYENGGLLTEAVRKNPHALILFDEIEKAHSDIYNVLLQVLDYGFLTDSRGRKADFRSCIVIFTSNAGARDMEKMSMGFGGETENQKNDEATLKEAVSRTFPPEFRNRLDAIVPFLHLPKSVVLEIARKSATKIAQRLKKKNVTLRFSDSVVDEIASKGYSREFGARNVERTAEQLLALPLVDEVLFGKLKNGGSVFANYSKSEGAKIEFSYE